MKTTSPRIETRYYTQADLFRRWLKRGERRSAEGDLAGALMALSSSPAPALAAIRASRERLDSLHGRVLDLTPRLRDLCWAIDAAEAQARDNAPTAAQMPAAIAAASSAAPSVPARAFAA